MTTLRKRLDLIAEHMPAPDPDQRPTWWGKQPRRMTVQELQDMRDWVTAGLARVAESNASATVRVRALELLGKDLGMWRDESGEDDGNLSEWIGQLQAARAVYDQDGDA